MTTTIDLTAMKDLTLYLRRRTYSTCSSISDDDSHLYDDLQYCTPVSNEGMFDDNATMASDIDSLISVNEACSMNSLLDFRDHDGICAANKKKKSRGSKDDDVSKLTLGTQQLSFLDDGDDTIDGY